MRRIEKDITNGKNAIYLRERYGDEAKVWTMRILAKKNEDYATNFVSHTPTVPNDTGLSKYDLAREILERNIWQKSFSRANVVTGIPKNNWLAKVKKAIAENKHIPKEVLNEYNSLNK